MHTGQYTTADMVIQKNSGYKNTRPSPHIAMEVQRSNNAKEEIDDNRMPVGGEDFARPVGSLMQGFIV